MRALTFVAFGLAFAGFDFRTDAIDLLPDPLGWSLVAIGAHRLRIPLATVGAAVAATLSVAEASLPFHHVGIDPVTGEVAPLCDTCPQHLRYDDVGRLRAVVIALAVVLGCAAIVEILHRLRTRVGTMHQCANLRRHLHVLEFLVPFSWALPIVIVVGSAVGEGEGYDPVWNGPIALVGLAAMVTTAGAIATLVRFSEFYPQPLAHLHEDASDTDP